METKTGNDKVIAGNNAPPRVNNNFINPHK
jgi:hypothetical protein